MSDHVLPPWLEGRSTQKTPTSANAGRWVKGMPSPNPKGRPPGILDTRSKITKVLMDDGAAVAGVVIAAALEGDLQACNIVIGRIAPAIKPQAERVAFDFDAAAPIPQQIEAVLTAIASGALAPDVGQMIIAALGTLADARAVADLEVRINNLETMQA